ASGQEVRFFTSSNLKDWDFSGAFGEGYGSHGGVWECPDLIELPVDGNADNKKWVLILNINPGCIFGGSATQYFIGEFDGKTFLCDSKPETVKWMDWGKDHYATVTFSNTGDRKIAMAWMSNWQYANEVPTRQFRSSNSIPRELSLYTQGGETYLASVPVQEIETLRNGKKEFPGFVDQRGDYNIDKLLDDNQGAYEIVLTIKNKTATVFGFKLYNEQGEQVDFCYNLLEKKFSMDRTKSGLSDFSKDFSAVTFAPIEKQDGYTLHIFVDKSSVECFDGNGKFVMTNLVFPSEPYDRLNFYAKGGVYEIESITVYSLQNK
ncbi:MAG: glycoside hydrolase family 32 protein, partial [Bacteroidaceae bacterium]|nr:glycoside hydrolase family 32 protein [Bacteroidaceae bacterium]